MKPNWEKLEKYRILNGPYGSAKGSKFGLFQISVKKPPYYVRVVMAPESSGWEHVSVSCPSRPPVWSEMCLIKNMFWDQSETVWQYHPPKEVYVNNMPFCLHLWKKKGFDMPLPPTELVGIK